MQQIKGSVIKSRLAFVEEHFGKAGLERLLESLAPADCQSLAMVLAIKWYPFELGERLDDAIVRVLADGDRQFFERLGEASAERNLTTVHKGFLNDRDPHAFLGKAPVIYRTYYDTGRREYRRTGDRAGVLTTFDAEMYSAPDCLTVVGWHRRALAMLGVADPVVVEEECRAKGGTVCRYRLSWA